MRIDLDRYGSFNLSDSFLRRHIDVRGDAAQSWLDTLPERMTDVLRELGATVDIEQPDLSYNLVLFVTASDDAELVVKFAVPSVEFNQESDASTALSVASGPKVVRVDQETGVLVTERILPGDPLSAAPLDADNDARITESMAMLALNIHERIDPAALSSRLPDVRRWTQALEAVDRASPLWKRHQRMIRSAGSIRDRLLAEALDSLAFLHGDLHHENVLKDASGDVRPFDPKGVIGPRAFEIGAFLLNPYGIDEHPDARALTERRIHIWSRVSGIAADVLRDWGYIAAVVSACWSAEDHGEGWDAAIRMASLIEDLRLDR